MPFYLYLLILIPLIAFSGWASAKVNSTFNAFDKVPNRACMTGYDAAVRLMRNRGVTDISVNRVNGKLSDHYHPKKKQVKHLRALPLTFPVRGKGASGGPIADSDIRAALRAARNAYETRTGSAPTRARPEKDKEEGALVQK